MALIVAAFAGGFAGVIFAGSLIAFGIWIDLRRTRRRIYGDK